MDRIVLDWSHIEDLVDILAEGVADNLEDINYIHGLSRGGLIPAVMLSHKLNIPYTNHPTTVHGKKVLIVDDIADSGETLKKWNNYQTAVLHYKPHTSKSIPSIWAILHDTDHWIVYPWEHPQAKTIQDYKLVK